MLIYKSGNLLIMTRCNFRAKFNILLYHKISTGLLLDEKQTFLFIIIKMDTLRHMR